MDINSINSTFERLPRIASFEQLGFGLFLHWGLYSQLGKGEWIQYSGPVERATYESLQNSFTASDFDANAWCRLAVNAGMKYACLTTRHHDGFSLYDTRGLNTYDAPNSPAERDLVAEYIAACRQNNLLPMLYHTTMDWHWHGKKTYDLDQAEMDEYLQYLNDSVEILCTQYGPIGGLWFDGNWSRPDLNWRVDELYATIRKHQPEAIIVNNTGLNEQGEIGHPEVDSVTFEQGLPTLRDQRGQPKYVAGEMCQTMNQHWGIGTHDFNYLAPGQIIQTLCRCRKAGANYLLNIGPTAQGGIPTYEGAVLGRVGDWVRRACGIIYTGRPLPNAICSGEDFILQTEEADFYFAFNLGRRGDANVTVNNGFDTSRYIAGYSAAVGAVRWIDSSESIPFTQDLESERLEFDATGYPYGSDLVVRIARFDKA